MVSRKLMACWAFVDFCLLVAGGISVALSIVWRAPNPLMNMVLTPADLTAGMVLGISLLLTFVLSIGAIVQKNHVTIGLVILNYVLLIDSIIIVVIGTFIWYYTLRERDNFHEVWLQQSRDTRIMLQDKYSCCGYFNASDTSEIGGTFCTQTQVDFLKTLQQTDDNAHFFCVAPITSFADMTLNNLFTTTYGFIAITISLILLSICVINKRAEDERFKKIDAKRGGRGFV